ncbi:MAG: GGDEF domain-containing protein [Lachnospiraceae bacterium]|nr:GGDEF domain-containing protein [Lachnospiraceae bacterium]
MEEKRNKGIKGVKIKNINIYMMVVSCILYIFLIGATIHASQKYNAMISATEDYIACEQNAELIKEGSDYLTEQVRLYTVTKDAEYVENYFHEVYQTKRRDMALEQMKGFNVSDEISGYLQTAMDYSNRLMTDEIYAFRLIAQAGETAREALPDDVWNMELAEEDCDLSPEEMEEKARKIVFGSAYQENKELIMENISYFADSIVEDTMQKQQKSASDLKNTMTQQRILISVLFIENIFVFILIILLVIKPLRIYIENIEDKEKLNVAGSYEFKYLALTYNDQYGHEMGDAVLKKVAKLLEENFRATDHPARIGGDEFAVILTDATEEMKPVIEEKVQNINNRLLNPENDLPKVSLSVGIAFSANGFGDDLYKKADSALYVTKENGRCGYTFYEEKKA